MSEPQKLLGQSAFVLLQHLLDRLDETQAGAVPVTKANAEALEMSWEEVVTASQELIEGGFATANETDTEQLSLQLTQGGIEAARRHADVGKAIDSLRTKSVTLPPEMRREFESIVADVEQKLRQQPQNKAALGVLAAGLVEQFETHVPEVTTLLRLIGL